MSIISRLFGKKETVFENGLVANNQIDNPLSLQVLFSGIFDLDNTELGHSFRSYHPSLSDAKFEIDEELKNNGTPIGMIGWNKHVIQVVGFDQPMPSESLESCITPSHYAQDLKDRARAHESHLILYYKGYDSNPINQYASMALVAGFLSRVGAIVITNESALTSFPAKALCGDEVDGDIVELLGTLPLPVLFCGFVKYEIEGINGVWLRTYGAPQLGLADMASLVEDHSFSQNILDIFNNVFCYLLKSGAQFSEGNTMQVGDDVYMKLRLPSDTEYFLVSEHGLFVAEFISEMEINQC
ncbi:DUF4261 domain-containing protein [Shewanella sp. 10N.286.51.B8]|uniref:DUF4261 domain-containing protein n=1 Tax=Shewanella sp. 10N.286.51.B8 TaxID=3229708 RepID=UPI00354E5615